MLVVVAVVAEAVLCDVGADDLGWWEVWGVQEPSADHETPLIEPDVLGAVQVARGLVKDDLVVVTEKIGNGS